MPKPRTSERGAPLVEDKKKLDLIHERFKYADSQWASIRKEAAEDMRHVLGDPWEPKEKLARKNAMRPTPANDEIGQYLNAVINGVRMNKRAVRFSPVGFGANDKTATFYADKMREIEYRSHAQEAYTRAFQNTIERGYGYVKVGTEYVTDIPGGPNKPHSAFNQRLVIHGLPDPDCIYPDPDFLDCTGRDWKWLFEIETQSLKDFRRNFPQAEITSFSPELVQYAKGWISNSGNTRTVRIASYWEVEIKSEILNAWEVRNPQTGAVEVHEVMDDEIELADGLKKFGATLKDKRPIDTPTVWQYRTNGVEILKKTEWAGKSIPYVAFFGKMDWADLGTGTELTIQSMTRAARGPNMLLAYYLACEAEIIGMTPKITMRVLKGTLDPKNAKKLQMANHIPVPYVEFEPLNTITGQPNENVGVREQFEPPIQAIEIAKEACRRAIQSALAGTPLPTNMQRDNPKLSGRAMDKFREAGQIGSFHFVDSFDSGVCRVGELNEDLIPKIHDTAGPTPVLDNQKKPKDVMINVQPGQPFQGQPAPQDALPSIEGLHAVTIDVGPDFASERQQASDFVDTFVGSPVFQALPPPMAMEILALLVKLKNLGPVGEEIAEILHPSDQENQMVPAAKVQEAVQMGEQVRQMLQAKIQEYESEKQAKVVEMEGRRVIAAQGDETKKQIAQLTAGTKITDRDKQSDTMILLQKMKEDLEMLKLHVTNEQQASDRSADISKTAAQLEQSTAMTERGHSESAREGAESRRHESSEGERARQATSSENAAARQSADRNAAEDRKVKAKAALKPNGRA